VGLNEGDSGVGCMLSAVAVHGLPALPYLYGHSVRRCISKGLQINPISVGVVMSLHVEPTALLIWLISANMGHVRGRMTEICPST
jgi:hypothetical protein